MTAVDHAELKRLAVVLSDKDIDSYKMPGKTANVWAARLTALLSEIEGLKARIKCLENLGGEQSLRVMQQATRAKDAENALASLRTQAPDSWRPDREAVARVLKAWCEGGLLQDYASVADAILALRPQTAESGK